MELKIFIDGGARGNPGDAASAAVFFDSSGARLGEAGEYLNQTTNNVAEYTALIIGLREASKYGGQILNIFSDSELLVKQWNGIYRIKNANLQVLSRKARQLAQNYQEITVTHVRREHNKDADGLVNIILDKHQNKSFN